MSYYETIVMFIRLLATLMSAMFANYSLLQFLAILGRHNQWSQRRWSLLTEMQKTLQGFKTQSNAFSRILNSHFSFSHEILKVYPSLFRGM